MKMKFSVLVLSLFLIVVTSAFYLDAKGSRRIIATKHRRNAIELKAYHQQRRAEAAAKGRNYVPNYPIEPLTTSITVGETKQKFDIAFASGADNLWLIDVTYPNVGPYTPGFNPKNPQSSAVEVGNFTSQSDEFSLYGTSYVDSVNCINTINQTFGSVTEIQVDGEVYNPSFDNRVSGVFGLSWNPKLKDQPTTPNSAPILNIFAADPYYLYQTFYFIIDENESTGKLGVITVFGGVMDLFCDPSTYVVAPLSFNDQTHSLVFQLDSFAFGDQKSSGDWAEVDTGLAVIYFPQDQFSWVYSAIQPDFDYDLGIYTTDCTNRETFDDFVFTIGGKELRVPSKSYVVNIGLDANRCVVAFATTNTYTTSYVLGTPLIVNYGVMWSITNSTVTFGTEWPPE